MVFKLPMISHLRIVANSVAIWMRRAEAHLNEMFGWDLNDQIHSSVLL